MTEQPIDPFASSESRPSVSFKDLPIGTEYRLEVTAAPKSVQSRNYDTGEPDWWDAEKTQPKKSVVIEVVDLATGEEKSLWAPQYPKHLFNALKAAQATAGAQIAVGGTLVVTLTGHGPQDNPRKNPPNLYAVTYTPPDAFAETPADPWSTTAPAAPAAASTPLVSTPVGDPQAAAAALAALTPEQRVALGIG